MLFVLRFFFFENINQKCALRRFPSFTRERMDRLAWWFPASARFIGERFEVSLEGAAVITSEGHYVRPFSPRVLTTAGTVVEKK